MKKGIFITFEGIDASGKTTQARKSVRYLREKGFDVLFLREPGGEPVSERIRKILLKSQSSVTPTTELMLYLASRSQLVEKKIIPALIKDLNRKSTFGIKPDLTLLIDVPLEVYLKRAKLKKNKDRLEKENLAFYRRIRRGYLEIAKQDKKRVKVIDGSGTISQTWAKVKELADKYLGID